MVYNFFTIIFMFFNFFSQISPQEKLVYKQIEKHAKYEKKERNLICCGRGVSMPHKIKGIVIDYQSNKQLDVDESRRLFVNVVEDLIYIVQNNIEIQAYLLETPFNYKATEIGLSFNREKVMEQPGKFVSYVSIVKNIVYYRTLNENGKLKDCFNEPYEEALRIVKEEGELRTPSF